MLNPDFKGRARDADHVRTGLGGGDASATDWSDRLVLPQREVVDAGASTSKALNFPDQSPVAAPESSSGPSQPKQGVGAWLVKAYAANWDLMPIGLGSSLLCTVAVPFVSHLLAQAGWNPSANSFFSSAADMALFYSSFAPLYLAREISRQRKSNPVVSLTAALKEGAGSLVLLFGMSEATFPFVRSGIQYACMQGGLGAAAASFATAIAVTVIYQLALPPLQYALEQFRRGSEANTEVSSKQGEDPAGGES